jgi:hypothetical protein
VTTTLPALDSTTHVSSVTYLCTFAPTVAGPVMFAVPQPVQFLFTFDTGTTQPDPAVDLFDAMTDSSWFDQTTEETAIKTALNGICALIAAMLPGATTATIQATVTIRRSWRISPNQTGTASPVQIPGAPLVYTEQMTYP